MFEPGKIPQKNRNMNKKTHFYGLVLGFSWIKSSIILAAYQNTLIIIYF